MTRPLTPTQRRVYRMRAAGLTRKEVAEALQMPPSTVSSHWNNIRKARPDLFADPDLFRERPLGPFGLTRNELDTLRLLADGHQSKAVVHLMRTNKEVVSHRCKSAREKIGAETTAHAIAILATAGVITVWGK